MSSRAALLALGLALSACLSNKVESLAPNMARLNFVGAEAPSDQEAFKALMLLSAEETLKRGYTHFRLQDWTLGPTPLDVVAAATRANFSVTVLMFHDGEQGSVAVFDARSIMRTQEPQQP